MIIVNKQILIRVNFIKKILRSFYSRYKEKMEELWEEEEERRAAKRMKRAEVSTVNHPL